MRRKRRTYYQQIADAVSYEKALNATLVDVTREHNKANFTFKHNNTGKMWRTTLSKLENYAHNKFKEAVRKSSHTYWDAPSWKKAGDYSKHFDGFKLYIIRCTKDDETFFKIGRTFNTLEKRFSGESFPYSYTVLKLVTGTAHEIVKLEKDLLKLNKEFKYKPSIRFSGASECFSELKAETYAD